MICLPPSDQDKDVFVFVQIVVGFSDSRCFA